MSQPEDRLVYVCGCGGSACIESNIGWRSWSVGNVGRECPACNQPVTAINLDRLLRIEEAVMAWDCDIEYGADLRLGAALDAKPGGQDDGE